MTPVYPAFDVQVATDHEDAFIKNCVAVRLTTLVPHEIWDEFQSKLNELTGGVKELG